MEKVINVDTDILGGTPVFWGTRVPVKNLFDYLETGETVDDFLRNFESVQRNQTLSVLDLSKKMIETSTNVLLDECASQKLKPYLQSFEVYTVLEMGWGGIKNGKLLSLCVMNQLIRIWCTSKILKNIL